MIYLFKDDNINIKEISKKFKDKPNIVYLDPPYNTKGSNLIYKDHLNSDVWFNKFNKLLKDIYSIADTNAVIFTSIGIEELDGVLKSYKEILGIKNIVAVMPRKTNNVGKTTKTISKINDFVVVGIKGKVEFEQAKIKTDSYKKKDEFFNERGYYQKRRVDYKDFHYSKSLDFEFEFQGNKYYPSGKKELFEKRKSGNFAHKDWCWIWSKERMNFALENDFLEADSNYLYKKTYEYSKINKLNGSYVVSKRIPSTPYDSLEFTDNEYSSDRKKNELDNFFSYPKSSKLIEKIIELPKFEKKVILDCYAGTGITGIKAYEKKHSAYLIQKSEKINKDEMAYKSGYKDIFDLTKDKLLEKIKSNKLKIYEE